MYSFINQNSLTLHLKRHSIHPLKLLMVMILFCIENKLSYISNIFKYKAYCYQTKAYTNNSNTFNKKHNDENF